MTRYRKTILILVVLTGVTSLHIIARNKEDEKHFKNLKVYPPTITAEELDRDMHLFARSLGVKCGYCHVKKNNEWDYADDSKHHKEDARRMMRMTNDLNERYFGADLKTAKASDLAMNCYTCHRGEEMPIIPWDTVHIKKINADSSQRH